MSAKVRPCFKIEIDPEFSKLIPRITTSEYKELEQNIIKDGCREPLSLWQNILLDGHNRYSICKKHDIKFNTIDIKLESRNAAKVWIIDNQLGRRNLNAFQRIELGIHLEEFYRAKGLENKRAGGKNKLRQNSDEAIDTKKDVAKKLGISHDTYCRGKKILEKGSEEIKEKLRNSEVSINDVYPEIRLREVLTKDPFEKLSKQDHERAQEWDLFKGKLKIQQDLSYALVCLDELPDTLKKINLLEQPEDKKEEVIKRLIQVLNSALTAVKDCLIKATEESEIKAHSNVIDV